MVSLPELGALTVMGLSTPQSAILSAVIFNALIIVALIPLALRGCQLPAARRGGSASPQPADLRASAALRRPFIGTIKLIDVIVAAAGIA